jgi:hypothetical protein
MAVSLIHGAAPNLLDQAAPRSTSATVVNQPRATHVPWVDDPAAFRVRFGGSSADRAQVSESIHRSRWRAWRLMIIAS